MSDTQQLRADMEQIRLRLEADLAAAIFDVEVASARLRRAHAMLAEHDLAAHLTLSAHGD